MFLRLIAFCASLILASATWANDELSGSPEIEMTISNQIEAFKQDDFAKAFTFASPSIQGIFGTPERFGQMVRNGYPMVWRPAAVRYLELREIAGSLWQKVEIRDQKGAYHYLDYQMIQEGGVWKISGVQLLKAPEVTA